MSDDEIKVVARLRAYAFADNLTLSIRMMIVQMDEDNEWRPASILRLGDEPWQRRWEEIEHDGTQVQPTLIFGIEEARLLYHALRDHFGETPPVIVHVSGELDEENAAKLREQIEAALRPAR